MPSPRSSVRRTCIAADWLDSAQAASAAVHRLPGDVVLSNIPFESTKSGPAFSMTANPEPPSGWLPAQVHEVDAGAVRCCWNNKIGDSWDENHILSAGGQCRQLLRDARRLRCGCLQLVALLAASRRRPSSPSEVPGTTLLLSLSSCGLEPDQVGTSISCAAIRRKTVKRCSNKHAQTPALGWWPKLLRETCGLTRARC